MFADRAQAGRQLAERLRRLALADPVVLALPRGGVPVGSAIAQALHAPLDLVLVRKLGAPGQPELAVGAVVDGSRPETVLNDDIVRHLGLSAAWIEAEAGRQLALIERRRERYFSGLERVPVAGRTAIVVDDGIATGASMTAALRATQRAGPRELILAVPVAPPETFERLRSAADRIVCLATPAAFMAVGSFYEDFSQVEDDEVIRLLREAAQVAPRAR